MFRRLSRIVLGGIIALLLFGCNNTEKKISEFENLINNKDYEFASNLYKENSDNEKFTNEINELISKKVEEYEASICDENITDVKVFIDFAAKFSNSDKINSISEKLKKLEKDKAIFEQGKKQIDEEAYYSGILKLKEIKEESKYYQEATVLINENLAKARAERIDSSRRLFEEKSYESAILALEDISKLIGENDIELNNLIEEYKTAKNNSYNNTAINEASNSNYNTQYSNVNYNNYYNTRFGYSIDYPSFLIEQPAPTNNDGRVFKSEDGQVSLTVYGNYNPLFETAEKVFNDNISSLSNISYKNLSGKSYVISWTEGNSIYYKCGIIEESLTSTFTLKYPSKDNEVFNGIVQRCYESFKQPNN